MCSNEHCQFMASEVEVVVEYFKLLAQHLSERTGEIRASLSDSKFEIRTQDAPS
jgi:hypothetical protein